jgi:hypothetical protein
LVAPVDAVDVEVVVVEEPTPVDPLPPAEPLAPVVVPVPPLVVAPVAVPDVVVVFVSFDEQPETQKTDPIITRSRIPS